MFSGTGEPERNSGSEKIQLVEKMQNAKIKVQNDSSKCKNMLMSKSF